MVVEAKKLRRHAAVSEWIAAHSIYYLISITYPLGYMRPSPCPVLRFVCCTMQVNLTIGYAKTFKLHSFYGSLSESALVFITKVHRYSLSYTEAILLLIDFLVSSHQVVAFCVSSQGKGHSYLYNWFSSILRYYIVYQKQA